MSKTTGQATFKRTDVPSAATTVLTSVTTRFARITGAIAIGAITMNAFQVVEVVFESSLTITHGAALDVANNGNNRTVQANDTAVLVSDASANVTFWTFTPHTTQLRLNMAQNGVIDFGGACNIAESGDAINFNNAAAGYVFNGGQLIAARSGSCLQLINGQNSVAAAEVASFEGDRSSPANGDNIYVPWKLRTSSGSTRSEYGRIAVWATDITAGSLDGSMRFSIASNNNLCEVFRITGGGDVVNGVEVVGSVTGGAVTIQPFGTDSGIGWTLASKGGGKISLASSAAQPTEINSTSITRPFAPLFLAYNSATDSDVTGQTGTPTADFDTEITDRGSDFAADTFTADVTGAYNFGGSVSLAGLVADTSEVLIELVTSNRTYRLFHDEINRATTTIPWAVICADLDAGDTAFVRVTATGDGANNADIVGNAAPYTYFGGHLVG